MSNYDSCMKELAPRLKKRGLDEYETTAAGMCAMRFPDDEEIPRKFSVKPSDTGEKRRAFALELTMSPDTFPEQFNKDLDIWEFPVLAITSGEHKYVEEGLEEKVYIEPSILKSNIESFQELPIYVNHQRTPDDLIGKAINPEIKEMDNGKVAIGMLAQVTNNERGQEIVNKMKDGQVTNVSIDWLSKDVDVMGDTYATSVRPVEVSFIDNEVAEPVCGECKIDTKCDNHIEKGKDEPCSCSPGKECGCNTHDGKNSEVKNMTEKVIQTEAETITEREFASIKNQLNDMTTSYQELEGKYEASIKAIADFEEMEAKRQNEAESLRKKELVNNIIDKEMLLGTLEDEKKDSRFEEMHNWDEARLSGFSAALENVPVPEETERSFGKGKARGASEAPVETEEPERERLFSMDKNGRVRFNKRK